MGPLGESFRFIPKKQIPSTCPLLGGGVWSFVRGVIMSYWADFPPNRLFIPHRDGLFNNLHNEEGRSETRKSIAIRISCEHVLSERNCAH
jgi:hypothetical protein